MKDIIEPHRAEMEEVFRRNKAHPVSVFGSVGRGTATKKSDIDLIVSFEPKASAFDHVGLIQELEDVFGRKVDAATASGLHWIVRAQVLFEAVPI